MQSLGSLLHKFFSAPLSAGRCLFADVQISGGESPLTIRARCAANCHCPNPLGNVLAVVKFQFVGLSTKSVILSERSESKDLGTEYLLKSIDNA